MTCDVSPVAMFISERVPYSAHLQRYDLDGQASGWKGKLLNETAFSEAASWNIIHGKL